MVDVNKLKGAIARAGYTQETLAKKMDMSVNTLNAKVNAKAKITTDEALNMCGILGIEDDSEKIEIFLA